MSKKDKQRTSVDETSDANAGGKRKTNEESSEQAKAPKITHNSSKKDIRLQEIEDDNQDMQQEEGEDQNHGDNDEESSDDENSDPEGEQKSITIKNNVNLPVKRFTQLNQNAFKLFVDNINYLIHNKNVVPWFDLISGSVKQQITPRLIVHSSHLDEKYRLKPWSDETSWSTWPFEVFSGALTTILDDREGGSAGKNLQQLVATVPVPAVHIESGFSEVADYLDRLTGTSVDRQRGMHKIPDEVAFTTILEKLEKATPPNGKLLVDRMRTYIATLSDDPECDKLKNTLNLLNIAFHDAKRRFDECWLEIMPFKLKTTHEKDRTSKTTTHSSNGKNPKSFGRCRCCGEKENHNGPCPFKQGKHPDCNLSKEPWDKSDSGIRAAGLGFDKLHPKKRLDGSNLQRPIKLNTKPN